MVALVMVAAQERVLQLSGAGSPCLECARRFVREGLQRKLAKSVHLMASVALVLRLSLCPCRVHARVSLAQRSGV